MPQAGVAHNEGREFYDDGYDSDEQSIGNRLDFSQLQFFGRQKELARLKEIWSHACRRHTETKASLPLIAGTSGSGKSTLVGKLMEDLRSESAKIKGSEGGSQKSFFFLHGKYEEMQCADPFSAIVAACSGFASELLLGDEEHLKRVREDVHKSLGMDSTQVLTSVVPDLKAILYPEGVPKRLSSSGRLGSDTNAWNRLTYVFQTFFKAISTETHPAIMFLDDLQWADGASLDLITSLLTDTSLRYFLLVGAVRSNEVSESLTSRLETIAKSRPVERIEVQNLLKDDLAVFVCEILNLGLEDTAPLTALLYEKTQGNIFFVKEMLEDLQRKGILFYDMIEFRWKWDLETIDLKVGLSDNVLHVVAGKIKSLDKKLQRALIVAAHTRSTFDTSTLEKLMETTGDPVKSEELVTLLDAAVNEGVLSSSVGSKYYRFAHDRIQQAAYSLVKSDQERSQLRESIGKCLFELASSNAREDWMLFVAADHLNATIQADQDILFMARLNLEVGERSSAMAAFAPASVYLQKGLDALGKVSDHWSNHYEISLRLYGVMADVENILGNYEVGHRLGQQVFDHAKSDEDKLPTFRSLAMALSRQERYTEARELHWDSLKLLGERRPRFLTVPLLFELGKVKRYLKKHSNGDIVKLPIMTDEKKRMIMELYDDLGVCAYYCGKVEEFVIANLRMLLLSFKYGLCGSTSKSFVKYGMALGKMGDEQGALRTTQLARQILERTGEKHSEAQTLFIIAQMIEPWSCPPLQTMNTLKMAHKSGMASGDFEFGFLGLTLMIRHAQIASYHLDAIDAAYTDLEAQLSLYNMHSNINMLTEMRFPARYLSGRMGMEFDLKQLDGFYRVAHDESENVKLLQGYIARMVLGVFFGDFVFAQNMAEKIIDLGFNKQDSASDTVLMRCYYSGLAASGLARQTGRRKYASIATKFLKEMKQLSTAKGQALSLHKQLLMEADLYSLGGHKAVKVERVYNAAIQAAVNTGQLDDAALGNELAGEYLLSKGDEESARTHFTSSIGLYQQWGALAKVHHLQTKRSNYLNATKHAPVSAAKWIHCDSSSFQIRPGSHDGDAAASGPPSRTKSSNSSQFSVLEHSASDL